jgi:hypothetical protein
MILIVGPFLLFSDLSPYITVNPVIDAKIELFLQINKHIDSGEMLVNSSTEMNERWLKMLDQTRIDSHMDHFDQKADTRIWINEDPFLVTYNEVDFANSEFSKETETRFFDPT